MNTKQLLQVRYTGGPAPANTGNMGVAPDKQLKEGLMGRL